MASRDFSLKEYENLLAQAEEEVKSVADELQEARQLSRSAGLSTEGDLSKAKTMALTGGHSNTDHLIVLTGDYTTDRFTELRRRYLTRQRAMQPESRGEDRWDRPRAPGERRRRITREKDLPTAPPEPPTSGYIVYLGQMTTKMRHNNNGNEPHSQSKVVQEISRLWRMNLSNEDRQYYTDFCEECRKEYKKLHMEFRATGQYTPSDKFERVDGVGLWVHKKYEDKNKLEREIASYDMSEFLNRPPEVEAELKRRAKESQERRKKKLKAEREQKQKEKEQAQLSAQNSEEDADQSNPDSEQ